MSAHALIIEPEESTREAAVDLLEEKGFEVTEMAGWPKDIETMISPSTTCVFIDAKTFDENAEFLDDLRSIDDTLPIFIVGEGLSPDLSQDALNAAVKAGGVQYVSGLAEAADKAIDNLRATLKRMRSWMGTAAVI